MKEIQELANKIKHLRQYKNLSYEEVLEVARDQLFSPAWDGLKSPEIKEAKKKYKIYRENYNVTSYSDLMLLGELIYNEIISKRYKKKIKEVEVTTDSLPSTSVIKALREIEDAILILREKLGFFERNKKNEFSTFMQKAKRYWRERGADQVSTCPYCGEMMHLAPNMEYFELHKFPFTQSRVLYNKDLISLYKQGKLTIEEVAKVLKTSVDYIKWVMEKFEKNQES